MNINHRYETKRDFNDSVLFSTEVSANSLAPTDRTQNKYNHSRVLQQNAIELKSQLKIVKALSKSVQASWKIALNNKIKAQLAFQRTSKQGILCRQDFLKLYYTKKFRIAENQILTDRKIEKEAHMRKSSERFMKTKMYRGFNRIIHENQEEQNFKNLRELNKVDKKNFEDELRKTQNRLQSWVTDQASKTKSHHESFVIRKRNLSQLSQTRSKFNYLSKVNVQMQAIKQYQDALDCIEEMQITRTNSPCLLTSTPQK